MSADHWGIALANVRLAGALAGRFAGRGLDRDDLVQEGLIGLHHAAAGFDPARGVRFSAYARHHLLGAMGGATNGRHWRLRSTVRLTPAAEPAAPRPGGLDGDGRDAVRAALGRLSGRERAVLARHFGLDGETPRTLREVGEGLGVSEQRAWQVERKALRKLAAILGDDFDVG